MTASMGRNTWAFTGTKERAHVAGDVAMSGKEVNPVILALGRSWPLPLAISSRG